MSRLKLRNDQYSDGRKLWESFVPLAAERFFAVLQALSCRLRHTANGKLRKMASASSQGASVPAPVRSPFLIAIVAWLIPGGGHFLLGRRGRGAIVFAAVLLTFTVGILMRGPMFQLRGGDLLTTAIQFGGFIGDLATGMLYLLTVWLGYSQPEAAGHVHDYGSKLIVAAGLLNILAMVDAWEIATGKKD